MASRQLRKLRQQQELLSLQKDAGTRSDDSDDEPIVARPRGTMFSGFAALGDTGDNDDDDDDDNNDNGDDGKQKSDADEEPAPATGPSEPAKKSKKSKKKKKKKAKQATAQTAESAAEGRKSLDDIDKVLEELKLESQAQAGSAPSGSAAGQSIRGLNELLRINLQHLKALNEMRRVFGRAMDVAETEERTQEHRQRNRLPEHVDLETYLSARAAWPGPGSQANKSMFDTILRTNPFIEGKKTWPRGTAQGLKMVRITQGQQQDEVEFSFAHDKEYGELEMDFFGLVLMYDPMQIVHFLYRFPYHVSSLIQVSKVARQDQNSALAADLIERALFTFGRVSLNEFRKKLERGQARMSFARPENRQFYLAGFNLIQKLVLKGTHRTALEWAKLFLSINHDDPYAMIHWVHVLAVRAREAEWFVDLCKSDLVTSNRNGALYAKQTLPLAHFQLGDAATAKAVLIEGMETLPWLYCSLFRALNLDAPRSVWGIVPRDPEETLHTELYIHMAKDLWNTPNHISLLREAAAAASPPNPSTLPKCPEVSLATARFVYLDSTPVLMSAVPRLMLHTAEPNFEFDPLPPPEAENVFSSEIQRFPWFMTANPNHRVEVGGGVGGGVDMPVADWLRQRIQRGMAARAERLRRRGVGGQQQEEEVEEWPDQAQMDALMAEIAGEAEGQAGGGGERAGAAADDEGPVEEILMPGPRLNFLNALRQLFSGQPAEGTDGDIPTGMPGGWGEGWNDDEEEEEGEERQGERETTGDGGQQGGQTGA
ncbi:hypothetical protein VTJ83DRAFT_6364 [Remersonia thermophila]|uniref:Uncharacterized protein n=1 Tax=Remersonia thermophila TaxID=72144 RepID=A0ABR4D5H0_9PEZI